MRLIVLLVLACVASFGPATSVSYYHWSDYGHNIYANSTVEASMNIVNPPPGITHTYTAALTLKGPKGNTVSGGPTKISENIYGTSWPVANTEIAMSDIGVYLVETDDTAYCSYIESIFFSDVGDAFDVIPPPYINSDPSGVVINNTTSNNFAVDSAGYMSIYGESLLCEDTCSQSDIQVSENDDPNVTILAIAGSTDQQVNVSYSIGSGATVGQHCVYVYTPYGVSNCGSYMIGDLSPTISSISLSTFVAGTSTPNVQISGANFGTNCPNFAITPTLAGSTFVPNGPQSCTDTLVTGTMNIDPNAAAGQDTVSLTAEGFNSQGFLPAQQGETQSASKTITVLAAPTIRITRSSLTQSSATGSPAGGTILWGAGANVIVSYASGDTAQSNPNAAVLSNGPNPSPNGAPSPGALSAVTGWYDPPAGSPVSSSFHVPTFGMSCYYTTTQQQWGAAPNSCLAVTIFGTQYSGYTANPTGLPVGNYCNSFLAEVTLQGSGQLSNGTDVQYISGGYPPSGTYRVVTVIDGADGSPVHAGQTVARDRSIIPTGGVHVDINGIGNGLLANDTGGAIVGYRIDYYNGAGPAACAAFSNIMAVSGCSPGNANCPADTAIQ